MNNDLVKRLRDVNKNYELARGVHVDISQAVKRIEELEAKLAKAVEGFEELARLGNGDRYGNSFGNLIAQKYIAELTGGKDE